jgi:NAD(P)H-flavin reductase
MLCVFGTGEVLISNSGNPYDPRRLIHTTRAVGAVTNVMVKLKKGDLIGIRGPYDRHGPLNWRKGRTWSS